MIPVHRPWMGEEEAEAARRVILSGWVMQGPEVEAFEREFASYTEATHACAVSSGTAALHIALLAAGVGPGDEVITVSHSFIASANVIRYCGATPVFCDISADMFNMNPDLIEALVTPRTRAILCVHQVGMPCDLSRILDIAERHSVPVVEDAACAAGSEILWAGRWEKIGKPHAAIACFSFHPRKLLTTGDGGMITTSNPDWARQCRLLRQHGVCAAGSTRHESAQVVFESYPVVGYNYRLTDIQAAVGRVQLRRLPQIVERRRALADRYRELLCAIPGVVSPAEPLWAKTNWQSYCVRLPERADQREVLQRMLDQGVSARRGVQCAHREPAYPPGSWRGAAADASQCLIESERAQDRSIILPLFHEMTADQQVRVVETLARVLRETNPCRQA